MVLEKGIIYYTDCRVREPIFSTVQRLLLETKIPILSCSLKPINFGKNICLNLVRSYPTMVTQIITALENSEADYVFFCENDVLYHKSHFDFMPKERDIFYYNSNVWRWRLWDNIAIRYEGMLPLSCMCDNRIFDLDHFKERLKRIKEWGGLEKTKVIILSNLGQEEDVKKGLEMGAVKYLVKAHFTPSQVVEEINTIL